MSKDLTTWLPITSASFAAMVEKARSGHPGGAMGGSILSIFFTRNTSGMILRI